MHSQRIPLVCVAILVALANPAIARSTLCKKSEINYSSCRSGARLISLCASSDLSGERGYMQFRYGRPGHLEVAYPDTTQHPRFAFYGKQYTFGDGAEYRLTFKVGDLVYVLFDNTVWPTPRQDGGIRHGLTIYRNGKIVKELPCINPTSTIHHFEGHIFGDGDLSAE